MTKRQIELRNHAFEFREWCRDNVWVHKSKLGKFIYCTTKGTFYGPKYKWNQVYRMFLDHLEFRNELLQYFEQKGL